MVVNYWKSVLAQSQRHSFDKDSIGSSLYSFIRILTLTLKTNPNTDPNPTPWT